MPGEIVVGLDVGTTKICAIVGEVGQVGSVQITGVGITPCNGLRKGVVVDMSATTRSIRESIAKAARQAQVEIHSVTVGVTGEHIMSVNTRGEIALPHPGSEISHADRDRALENAKVILCPPDRQILHTEPRHYTVDGQEGIRKPVGMSGSRLEVEAHLVTAARSFVENVVRSVEKAGLAIDEGGVILESLATAEAVLTQEERDLGVSLIDIGGGTTDLAIFENGTVCHSAVIPVGGRHVTQDLTLGLQVSDEEAERLKREFGTALAETLSEDDIIDIRRPGSEEPIPLPRQLLAQIIEPRIEELFELVGKEIEAAGPAPPRGGLVVTGGASQLPGTLVIAERMLPGIDVRLGLPRCAGGVADTVSKPPYATAVGLVMLAARREFNAGNPEDHEEELFAHPVQGWLQRLVRRILRPRGR